MKETEWREEMEKEDRTRDGEDAVEVDGDTGMNTNTEGKS